MKTPKNGLVVAIDAMCLQQQGRGIPCYIENLIKGLAELDNINTYIIFAPKKYFQNNNYAVARDNFKYIYCNVNKRWLRLFWQLFVLPFYLKIYNVDVFHATYHVSPLLRGRWRLIVTIHDMVHFAVPHFLPPVRAWYLRKITFLSCKRAGRIIAVSKDTKNDITKDLRIQPDKIKVIYLAPRICFKPKPDVKNLQAVKQRYATTDNFMLFVGALKPRKNAARVIQAFSLFTQKSNTDYRLVIAAQKTKEYKVLRDIKEAKAVAGKIIFAGYVKPEELSLLYNAASLVIYPTLYEGFGLPIVEAMASGTPVITSNISAQAEIAGDSAKLINPYDIKEIAQAMFDLVNDSSQRQALIDKGFKRAAMFNWQKTAQETLDLYKEI